MLRQAVNALRHGLEHLDLGSPEDRAFAFEHFDQAAELLLKEKVRQLGESIYRRGHESITLFGAKRKLEQRHVQVPFWSDVEVMHERRNVAHHVGDVPDEDTTKVYLSAAMPFFETFLHDQFGYDLDHLLESTGVSLPGKPRKPVDKLLAEARRTVNTQPRSSIMTASTAVELVARPLAKHPEERSLPIREIGRRMVQSNLWSQQDFLKFERFLQIRNRAAHGAKDPSRTDATFAVEAAKDWVEKLSRLSRDSEGPVARTQ